MLVVIETKEVTRVVDGIEKKYQSNSIVEAKSNGTPAPAKMARTSDGYLRPAVAQIPGFGYVKGMTLEGKLFWDNEEERWDVLVAEVTETANAEASLEAVA
jgi:hypothetical protein